MKKLLLITGAFAMTFASYSQLEIEPFAPSIPGTYLGDFDNLTNGTVIPDNSAWTAEGNVGTNDWTIDDGTTIVFGGSPNYAYASIANGESLTLISPEMNFGLNTITPTLEFDYLLDDGTTAAFPGAVGQSNLQVMYKESAGGSWTVLATYNVVDNVWHNESISLTGASSYATYYLGFKVTTTAPGTLLPDGLALLDEIVVTGSPNCSNSSITFPKIECDSYTVPSGDETYTSTTANIKDTIPNMAGCDSLMTINLTINYSNTGTDVQTSCDSLVWINGITYYSDNSSATYIETNQAGCDSVVTLNLTVTTIDNTVTAADPVLTANQSGAGYVWLDCNNSYMPIGGANNMVYTATSNGDYSVEIQLNGCKDTSNCFPINTLGIEENNMEMIKLYPNPNSGILNIDFGTVNGAVVKIYSADGRLILTKEQNYQALLTFNFDQPEGIYFMEVSTKNEVVNMRLVKN